MKGAKLMRPGDFDPGMECSFDEENQRDDAVRKIQGCFRRHHAVSMMRVRIRNNYVKLYDRENDMYIYKNKMTGATSFNKPLCLGSGDLDLPKSLRAPEDYDVGYLEAVPEGWFLGVFSSTFPRSGGRLKDMEKRTKAERDTLAELMPHDFICRFRPENVIILDDPQSGDVLNTLNRLSRICKEKGFFVFYISTHVVTAFRGEKKNNSAETCYFATKETVWTTPAEIAASSISLASLCKLIALVPCKRKSCIVSCAHNPEPKRSIFSANKSTYPPHDFLSRMADLANAAVIGSCVTGNSMKDVLRHTASLVLTINPPLKRVRKKKDSMLNTTESAVPVPNAGERTTSISDDDIQSVHSDFTDNTDLTEDRDDEEVHAQHHEKDSAADFLRMLDGKDHTHDEENTILAYIQRQLSSKQQQVDAFRDSIEDNLRQWKVPKDEEIFITPQPVKLGAAWSKNATGSYDVVLPSTEATFRHQADLAVWGFRRLFAPPVNFVREKIRQLRRRVQKGPCQMQLFVEGDQYSLFGNALIAGLRGGAHRPDKCLVSAEMLFRFLQMKMKEGVDQIVASTLKVMVNEANELAAVYNAQRDPKNPNEPLEVVDDARIAAIKATIDLCATNQTPLLFVPSNNARAAKNPICVRCGPPAAPEQPFVIKTTANEAVLEWYLPDFDGVPPHKFQIEMRNRSRVFNEWKPIRYTPDIQTTRFRVRDLPSGVACQFRVSAFNNGGWSKESEETASVIPGEELTPLLTAGRWRLIAMGGSLAMLDKMKNEPGNRLEIALSLQRIASIAQKSNGFTKGTIQLRAAQAAITCMQNFPIDPEIAQYSLHLVGWCLLSGPATDKVKAYLASVPFLSLLTFLMESYRAHSGIVNSISFIRKSLAKVPQPPPVVIPHAEEDVPRDELLSSDDEDNKEPGLM